MSPAIRALSLAAVLAGVAGCGDDTSGIEPAFPASYADTYTEVRACRPNGGSHDFNRIRVLADPVALDAYSERLEPFPVGSVVLKEEYGANDMDCSGAIVQWSVMEKLPDGNEELLNWRWQQVDFGRTVLAEDEPRCYGCHAACVPPDGYDGTCTVP